MIKQQGQVHFVLLGSASECACQIKQESGYGGQGKKKICCDGSDTSENKR